MMAIHPGLPALVLVMVVAVRMQPRPTARTVPRDTHSEMDNEPGAGAGSPRWPWRAPKQPFVSADAAAQWCDAIAREVRSGATLSTAVRAAEPNDDIAPVVAPVRHALERGRPLTEALQHVQSQVGPNLHLVAVMLTSVARLGGPAAEPIDRAAVTLRARAAIDAERLTQSAQARLSALVMTLLPVAMLSMLLITSPSVRGATTTPVGLAAVGTGAALNLAGWRWMRRITRGGRS